MTWGVLGAAIQALLNLMWTQAWWGAALSTVFDGENEVGSLIVSTSVPGAAGQGPSAGGDPSISSGSSTENEESVSKPPGGHR